MEAEFECTIDVAEDGLVKVFATDGKLGDACIERIGLLTRRPRSGDIVEGRVASTTSFGAFVTLKPGTDGLVHISRSGRPSGGRRSKKWSTGATWCGSKCSTCRCRVAKRRSACGCSRTCRQRKAVSTDEYRLEHLPNGQRLVTEKLDHLRSVCLGFWIPAGSRDEPGRSRAPPIS